MDTSKHIKLGLPSRGVFVEALSEARTQDGSVKSFDELTMDPKVGPWKMEFEWLDSHQVGSMCYNLDSILRVGKFVLLECEVHDERLHLHSLWMVVRTSIFAVQDIPEGNGVLVLKRGSNERYFLTKEMALACIEKVSGLDADIDTLSGRYFGRSYNDMLDYLDDRQELGNLKEDEVFITHLDNLNFQGLAEIKVKDKIHLVNVVGLLTEPWNKAYPHKIIKFENINGFRYYLSSALAGIVFSDLTRGKKILSSMQGRSREEIATHLLSCS